MKIMLGDFNWKLEREVIFNPAIGIGNLHENMALVIMLLE
jgi:hypothetical protein